MNAILETIKQPGVTFDFSLLNGRDIQERDTVPTQFEDLPTDQIPQQSEDPSYVIPKRTKNAIAEGFHVITKDGGDDAYTTGSGDSHCWTEQWWVEYEVAYDAWAQTGYSIDCATTSSCTAVAINLTSACTTQLNSWNNAVELGLTETWDGKVKVLGIAAKLGIEANEAYTHENGGSSYSALDFVLKTL